MCSSDLATPDSADSASPDSAATDADADGYAAADDCDDADPDVHPGADDDCDGVDDDCDGTIDGGWTVPGDYPTISAAIAAATGGEHICVAAGTWTEDLDFDGKDIVVESVEGADTTIVEGTGVGPVVTFANGEGATAELIGFTITGGGGYDGGGLAITDAGPTLTDLVVSDNHLYNAYAVTGGGILVDGGTPTLVRVGLRENKIGRAHV